MTGTSSAAGVQRPAWNKGKITDPKPPLRPVTLGRYAPSWIWRSARMAWQCSASRLTVNCVTAISSRSLVDDVAPNGFAKDRANVRQRKAGSLVRFELTEPARQTLGNSLRMTKCKAGTYLFPGGRTRTVPLISFRLAQTSAVTSGPLELVS
jgi:hypothetical protein